MTTITFDTLGYFEKLKAAGFTEEQAKVQVEAMQGVVRNYDEASRKELATKSDIQDLRNEIHVVRTELKEEIANTKHEILKWMMGMVVAQTALIVAVIGVGIAFMSK